MSHLIPIEFDTHTYISYSDMQKRVIQAYKAPHQWVNGPPGLGDFVRGIAHLVEKLQGSGIEFRVDISQTGFASLIEQDPAIFHRGEEARIAAAEEYFVDHQALHNRLVAFLHSSENELYICTNVGAWNRTTLPLAAREFAKKFYCFHTEIERQVKIELQADAYEVLSVRCGDRFYNDTTTAANQAVSPIVYKLIEEQVLPRARKPVVITSDCHPLKLELSKRYGMLTLPHRSQHGAFGNVLPVAMDMCMLKNSSSLHHINLWATWWSGFSHYTSVIFRIPSVNFRAPVFAREEITVQGELITTELIDLS